MAIDPSDPLVAAMLRQRGGGVSFGGGSILVPQSEQRMKNLYVQQLLGADPASARTKGEGVARLGQQLLGAYLAKQGMDEAKAQQDSDSGLMAAALRSQDRAPTTLDDGGVVTWNKPDPSTMASILGQGSPRLQEAGLMMTLNQQQREADRAAKTVKTLTDADRVARGLPPGAYQEDFYGKIDQIAKAPLFGMSNGAGGPTPPSTGGTQTVPRAPAAGGGPMADVPLSPQARATIGVESGGNADAASSTSSATGPAQFIDSTWLSMMQKHAPGLIQGKSRDEVLAMRSDPEIAGAMTDAYAKENDAALRGAGLEPTPADLHFAHTFGPGGAIAMLKADQRAPAANLNSRAVVEANRPLFFEKNGRPRTVAELRQTLGDRFNQNLPQEAATTADAMPNPAAPRGVQVAQANAGTMTDAAPAAASPSYRRVQNPETGAYFDFELPVDANGNFPMLPGGQIDISRARPYREPPEGYREAGNGRLEPIPGGPKDPKAAGLFSGNSTEGQALSQLVESGLLTKEQALTWAAGKTVTGPNGQLDFITPQAKRSDAGTPAEAPLPSGTQPSGPSITPVRQGQLAPQDKDAIMEADRAAEAASGAIGSLKDALKINRQAFEGSTAPARQWLDRNIIPGEWGGQATTDLENIVGTQALGQLKAIFGAAPTEGERKILLDLQGSVRLSADEREAIFKRAIAAAETRLQREQGRAKALRGGTYYTEGLPQQAQPPVAESQGAGRILKFDAQGNMIQ